MAVIIRYTIITARIERAAQDQAEASLKPVVVLDIELRSDNVDITMERIQTEDAPQATMLVVSDYRHFIVRNIGTGPAINLEFDFVRLKPDPGQKNRYARNVTYLSSGAPIESPISASDMAGENYRFIAKYESLSHKRYCTDMTLEYRNQKTILVRENWTFEQRERGP